MGEFVNFIRGRLGLEPKREVTLTGKIPNEVIINRSISEGPDPTFAARDNNGKKSSLNKLSRPKKAGNIGLDSNLPVNFQSWRRRENKRDNFIDDVISEGPDLESGGTTDAIKQNLSGTLNSIPTTEKTGTTELPNDGGFTRGTKVKINKVGYEGTGNIDFFDKSSGMYVVSADGGHNINLNATEIEPIKGKKNG